MTTEAHETGGTGTGDAAMPTAAPHTRGHALPELGDWEGPIFGKLGVLHTDGTKVECHCCGRWFRFLATHVWRTHQVTADEYRALFGLAARHGLVSPAVAELLRVNALRVLRPWYEHGAELTRSRTFEQLSASTRGRRLRLETRLSSRWQAARRAIGDRQAERERARYQSLDATGRAAFLARFGAPRAQAPSTCVVCGTRFFSGSRGPRAKTCSPDCARTHKQRVGLALRTTTRPEVRAQISAAARRRRPEYEGLVAALRALDAAAFDHLPTVERDLVRLYYGLDPADGRPRSLRELMALTGLAQGPVQRLLRGGVLRLLDPATAGLIARCVVCGRPFVRGAVNSARVTCGPACARERSRATLRTSGGQDRLSAAARERGRTSGAQLRDLDAQDPAAFEVLSARDRLIVRLYHGLPVEGRQVARPWTQREIAEHLGAGLTTWQVTQVLTRGLERLLRPDEARSDEQRRAARRARISAAARARGRPGAAALRALAPEVFERLREPQRSVVRRYYGLADGRPWTRRELASACGWSTTWVARAVAQGTAQLLGERAPRPAERPCLVCGVPFALDPGAYRSTRQTCGEACQRELRRRRAIASRAARRRPAGPTRR